MSPATESGIAVSWWFGASMFAAITLALGSPACGQALGVEAYLYGDVPVPPHLIADNYIERMILPGLKPELGPLWLEAKDAEQSMDGAIDAYFSSRQASAPGADLRQTYLRTLLLLKHLRNALIIWEQLSMTPDTYAARAGEAGFLPIEARTNYLAKAETYVAGGDNPQQAALKAVVSLIHDRDRQRGARVQECYFENPQTKWHPYCVNMMMGIDQVFRDVTMAEMFPLDKEELKKLQAAHYGNISDELLWSRSSIIDVTSQMLLTPCQKGGAGASFQSCWPKADFRRHRETAILNALENREDYRAALLQKKSQIAQADRDRVSAEIRPLSGFLSLVAAGMGVMIVIADMNLSARSAANAANPAWIGHEDDEWCYTEYPPYSSGFTQINTYCQDYNGWTRGITGWDGSLLSAVGALLNSDRCSGVTGWCKPK